MKVITKSDRIASVSERWDGIYSNTKYEDKIEIGNKLRSKKPKTEEEITKIIGNNTWTRNICHECENNCEVVIELCDSVCICPDCLNEALSLIGKNTQL